PGTVLGLAPTAQTSVLEMAVTSERVPHGCGMCGWSVLHCGTAAAFSAPEHRHISNPELECSTLWDRCRQPSRSADQPDAAPAWAGGVLMTRGRPVCLGVRGGSGSERAASRRKRV